MGGWAGWGVAEAQNLVNTVVLRWRGAKNIGIYGVFLFREREKSRKHRLFDPFGGVCKNRRFDDFGGLAKSTNYKDNNDNDNRTKQQQL